MINATPKTAFGRWLLDRFSERGWDSYRQAAEYTGVSHTQLRIYVQTETEPRTPVLERLAEKFDTPLRELQALLRKPPLDNGRIAPAELREAVRIGVREALVELGGTPLRVPALREETVAYGGEPIGPAPDEWYTPASREEQSHTFRLLRVSGDCLAPEIESGNEIVVDISLADRWRAGDVVAVRHDGLVLVKRVESHAGQAILTAPNGTRIIPNGETRVLGVVREVRKKLR